MFLKKWDLRTEKDSRKADGGRRAVSLWKRLCVLAVLLCACGAMWGETYYWVGGNAGNWDAETNWNTKIDGSGANGVPGAYDTAIIDRVVNGVTITLTSNVSVGTLSSGSNQWSGDDYKHTIKLNGYTLSVDFLDIGISTIPSSSGPTNRGSYLVIENTESTGSISVKTLDTLETRGCILELNSTKMTISETYYVNTKGTGSFNIVFSGTNSSVDASNADGGIYSTPDQLITAAGGASDNIKVRPTSYTWTGDVNTDWDNPNNWAEGAGEYYPNSGSLEVSIPSGCTNYPQLDVNVNLGLKPITVASGATVDLNGHQLSTSKYVNQGTLTGTGGTISGSFENNGTIYLTSGSLTITGNFENKTGATQTISVGSSGTITFGGTFTGNGVAVTIDSDVQFGGDISGVSDLTLKGETVLTTGISIDITGALKNESTISGGQTLTLKGSAINWTPTGEVTANVVIDTGASITLAANLTCNGDFTNSGTVSGNGNVNVAGTLTDSGTWDNTGEITFNGSGTQDFKNNGATTYPTVNINNDVNVVQSDGTTANGFKVETLNVATEKTLTAADITVDTSSEINGTVSATSVSVTGGTTLNNATITTSGNQTYTGNVVLATTNTTSTLASTSTATSNSITLSSGVTGTGTLEISGTTATGGTTTFTPGGAVAVNLNIAGNVTLGGDLNVGDVSTSLVKNLSITSTGVVTSSSAIKVNGDLTNVGTISGSGTIIVTGTLDDSVGTWNHTGTITLNGTNPQIFKNKADTEYPTVNIKNNVNVVQSDGTTANGFKVGTLTIDTGKTLSAAAITVGTSATIEGSITATSLSNAGTTSINGTVTTTGDQMYTGKVTLTGDDSTFTVSGASNKSTFYAGFSGQNSHKITINGNTEIGGDHSSSFKEIAITGGDATFSGKNTFKKLTITNGNATFSDANTFESITVNNAYLGAASEVKFAAGKMQTIKSCSFSGSEGKELKLTTTSVSSPYASSTDDWLVYFNPTPGNTDNFSYVVVEYSKSVKPDSGGTGTADNSLDFTPDKSKVCPASPDTTTNWFKILDYYWIGGTGDNGSSWDVRENWSTSDPATSSVTPPASPPINNIPTSSVIIATQEGKNDLNLSDGVKDVDKNKSKQITVKSLVIRSGKRIDIGECTIEAKESLNDPTATPPIVYGVKNYGTICLDGTNSTPFSNGTTPAGSTVTTVYHSNGKDIDGTANNIYSTIEYDGNASSTTLSLLPLYVGTDATSGAKTFANLVFSNGAKVDVAEQIEVLGTTTIKAGSGKTISLANNDNTFTGAITIGKDDATTPVNGGIITITGTGEIKIADKAYCDSLTMSQTPTPATGTTTLLGSVTTVGSSSGTQIYGNPVTVSGGGTLKGSEITFNSTTKIVDDTTMVATDSSKKIHFASSLEITDDKTLTIEGNFQHDSTITGGTTKGSTVKFVGTGTSPSYTISSGAAISADVVVDTTGTEVLETDLICKSLIVEKGTFTIAEGKSVTVNGDLTNKANGVIGSAAATETITINVKGDLSDSGDMTNVAEIIFCGTGETDSGTGETNGKDAQSFTPNASKSYKKITVNKPTVTGESQSLTIKDNALTAGSFGITNNETTTFGTNTKIQSDVTLTTGTIQIGGNFTAEDDSSVPSVKKNITLGTTEIISEATITCANVTLNGNVTLKGDLTFDEAVTLGGDITIDEPIISPATTRAKTIKFASTIDGAHKVEITSGATVFAGDVGVAARPISLFVNGNAEIKSEKIFTSQRQAYSSGAVSVSTADALFDSESIAFDSDVKLSGVGIVFDSPEIVFNKTLENNADGVTFRQSNYDSDYTLTIAASGTGSGFISNGGAVYFKGDKSKTLTFSPGARNQYANVIVTKSGTLDFENNPFEQDNTTTTRDFSIKTATVNVGTGKFVAGKLSVSNGGHFVQTGKNTDSDSESDANVHSVGTLLSNVENGIIWDANGDGGYLFVGGDINTTDSSYINFNKKNVRFKASATVTGTFLDLIIPDGITIKNGNGINVLRHVKILTGSQNGGKYVSNDKTLYLAGYTENGVVINENANNVQNLGNVVINVPAPNTISKNIKSPVTIGTLDLQAGTLDITDANASLVVNGVTKNSGNIIGGPGKLTFSGDYSSSASATFKGSSTETIFSKNVDLTNTSFKHNGGKIIFNGTDVQNFATNEQWFNNIELDCMEVKASGNVNVTGDLTVTNGKLDVAEKITIKGNLTDTGDMTNVAEIVFCGTGGAGEGKAVQSFEPKTETTYKKITVEKTDAEGQSLTVTANDFNATDFTITKNHTTTFEKNVNITTLTDTATAGDITFNGAETKITEIGNTAELLTAGSVTFGGMAGTVETEMTIGSDVKHTAGDTKIGGAFKAVDSSAAKQNVEFNTVEIISASEISSANIVLGTTTINGDTNIACVNATFNSTIDSASGVNKYLIIYASDTITVNKSLGQTEKLSEVKILSVGETKISSDADISTVGDITFGDNTHSGKLISDSASTTENPLMISSDSGNVIFTNGVELLTFNVNAPSGNIFVKGGRVLTSGTQVYNGKLMIDTKDAEFKGSDVASSITLNGDVESTVKATFKTPVEIKTDINFDASDNDVEFDVLTLSGDLQIACENASFKNMVDGAHNLSVNSVAIFESAIGNVTPLSSIDVTKTATINGGVVKTSGNQIYKDSITLANGDGTKFTVSNNDSKISLYGNVLSNDGGINFAGDVYIDVADFELKTPDGDVAFEKTVKVNNRDISILSGTGNITFNGAVGDSENDSLCPNEIKIENSGDVFVYGDMIAESDILFGNAGTVKIGKNENTDVLLSGANITFNKNADILSGTFANRGILYTAPNTTVTVSNRFVQIGTGKTMIGGNFITTDSARSRSVSSAIFNEMSFSNDVYLYGTPSSAKIGGGDTEITIAGNLIIAYDSAIDVAFDSPIIAKNIVLYAGDLTVNKNLTSTEDIVLLGKDYAEDDGDSEHKGEFMYTKYRRKDYSYKGFDKATLDKFPDGKDLPSKYNGTFTVAHEVAVRVGENFFANGLYIKATSKNDIWFLDAKQNSDGAICFIEAYAAHIGNSVVRCYEDKDGKKFSTPIRHYESDDHIMAKGVADDDSCFDEGENENWDLNPFKIVAAYTVSDNVVRIELTGALRNLHKELENNLEHIKFINSDGVEEGFAKVYREYKIDNQYEKDSEDSIQKEPLHPDEDVTSFETINGKKVYYFYLQTKASVSDKDSSSRWNTDATGKSPGNEKSTDNHGKHQAAIPSIKFERTLGADTFNFTNRWGKILSDSGTTYEDTTDRASPVLTAVYSGQEKHTQYEGTPESQHSYDAHNYLEFIFSEPVDFGSTENFGVWLPSYNSDGVTPTVIENVRVSKEFGAIDSSGAGLSVAGLVKIGSGSLETGTEGKSDNTIHAFYRSSPHKLRLSIAGYTDGVSEDNDGNEYKKWIGYIDSAFSPVSGSSVELLNKELSFVHDLAVDSVSEKTAPKPSPNVCVLRNFVNYKNGEDLKINFASSETYLPDSTVGLWDVIKPSFAVYRRASDNWNKNELDEAEAIGSTIDGTSSLKRIEFHLFDNEPAFNDSDEYEWVSKQGWVNPYVSSMTSNPELYKEYSYAADVFGGARPFDGNPDDKSFTGTTGGIRYCTIADANDAFKYIEGTNGTPDVSFDSSLKAFAGASSPIFMPTTSPTRNPSGADCLYFGYNLSETILSIRTQFTISYDSKKGYITDLAGNRLGNGKDTYQIKTTDLTPPSFNMTIAPVGQNKIYIMFAKPLSVDKVKLIDKNDKEVVRAALTDAYPAAFGLYSLVDGENINTESTSLKIDSSVPAKILYKNDDYMGLELTLSRNVTFDDIQNLYLVAKPQTEEYKDPIIDISSTLTTFIQDDHGNYMLAYTAHALSDFAVDVVNPLYAYNETLDDGNKKIQVDLYGDGSNAVHDWNAEQQNFGTLIPDDEIHIISSVNISDDKKFDGEFKARIYLDSNSPQNTISDEYNNTAMPLENWRIWLPKVDGFTKSFTPISKLSNDSVDIIVDGVGGKDYDFDFVVPKDKVSQWASGNQISFLFGLHDSEDNPLTVVHTPVYDYATNSYSLEDKFPLFALRLKTPGDLTSLDLWSFKLRSVTLQRGGVTILNNVINASNSEKVAIKVDNPSSGKVDVIVMTLDGNVVDYLNRGNLESGTHYFTWNGRNRNGKAVARGMYFVRVIGNGFDETRKVMVIK